jgi:predicted HicB family RNase H-like nuclease
MEFKMKKNLEYYLKLDYPLEVQKINEEDSFYYVVTIPYLGKGTFTAMGESIQEAVESLTQLKEYLFELMISKGKEIPEPPKNDLEDFSGKFSLRIPKYLHQELKETAEEQNVSLNEWINHLLVNNLNKEKSKKCEICMTMRAINYKIAPIVNNAIEKEGYYNPYPQQKRA